MRSFQIFLCNKNNNKINHFILHNHLTTYFDYQALEVKWKMIDHATNGSEV